MSVDHLLATSEHIPAGAAGDGPVVVLVHGSLDRAGSFARVTRRLKDLHTLAYDRRGYHRSRTAAPIEAAPVDAAPVDSAPVDAAPGEPLLADLSALDRHIADLVAVIDGRPAVVVGHSYGGVIALGAALGADGPGSILAVAAYEPPLPWLGSWATRGGRSGSTPRRADEDHGMVAERFFRRMVGDSAWDRLPEEAKEARRADGAALSAEIAALRRDDAPFDIAALTIPAVFGRGTASLPHHREAVTWLLEHVPGSKLVEFDGAGPGAHLTHPDAFARFVWDAVALADGGVRGRPSTPAG